MFADFISEQASKGEITEAKVTLNSLAKKHGLSPFQHHVLKGITHWAKENAEQDEEDMEPDAKGLKKHNVKTVDDVKKYVSKANEPDYEQHVINHAKKFKG